MPTIAYYRLSLTLLQQLLEGAGYDNWIAWLNEDLRLWDENQSTEHHLRAYGGMGSFNDVMIGSNDTQGLWKGRVFGMIQSLAYGLAQKNIDTAPLDSSFYGSASEILSGWRCRACGHAIINEIQLEQYLAGYFLPKFMINYLKEDKLSALLAVENLINSIEVITKREVISQLIQQATIELTTNNQWRWTCPRCQSTETCSYRWELHQDGTSLLEAADNLEML